MLRRHHSLRDAFAAVGREAGYTAATEVYEPRWSRARMNEEGQWELEQARLDCRFDGPPSDPLTYGDVVVSHPEAAAWARAAADRDGATAESAAQGKHRRYPVGFLRAGGSSHFQSRRSGGGARRRWIGSGRQQTRLARGTRNWPHSGSGGGRQSSELGIVAFQSRCREGTPRASSRLESCAEPPISLATQVGKMISRSSYGRPRRSLQPVVWSSKGLVEEEEVKEEDKELDEEEEEAVRKHFE